MNRPASLSAAIFLAVIGLIQLCRFLLGVSVVVGGVDIPPWASAIAAIVLGYLAVWLFKERSSGAE